MFAERKCVEPAHGLPLHEAAPQVVLDAGSRLIAVLGRLGEQLHHDRRDHLWQTLTPLSWRHGSLRDVAVHPSHRIRRSERQLAGRQFVEDDAERVEVAAGVNRPVHPAGLLRRHVGECSRNELRRFRQTTLAREARRNAESPQPDAPRPRIDHHVGGFDVLVDKAAGVQLTERGGQTIPNPQALADPHRCARASKERFATGILEDEYGTPLVSRQRPGAQRPCGIQVVPQRVFVLQHPDGRWSRLLRPRHYDEHRTRRRGRVGGDAAAAQHELTVLEKSLKLVWQEDYGRGFRASGLHASTVRGAPGD